MTKLVALLALALVFATPARAADGWVGNGVLAGGKGYVSTPMGQVHYRDIGPRDAKVPLLLIHQAWMSMIEYGEIQNELAQLGYRSIALDTPAGADAVAWKAKLADRLGQRGVDVEELVVT